MIIAGIAEQGGVGKTTLCHNLGWYLSTKNKKVLLVDTDPQKSNLSALAGLKNKDRLPGIFEVICGQKKISDVVVNIRENLDLIPANEDSTGLLPLLYSDNNGKYKLKEALKPLKKSYDFIFIDSSAYPTCHIMPLIASDYVLIPSKPDGKSIDSTKATLESYLSIKEQFNPNLQVLAVVENGYSNRKNNLSKASLSATEMLCKMLNVTCAKTKIPQNTDIGQTVLYCAGITETNPKSAGAKGIIALSNELFGI